MTSPLRPMNLGEILDRTLQIYRARFLAFVLIAAIPALVMMAIELANIFWLRLFLQDTEKIIFQFTFGDLFSMLAYYHASLFLHLLVWPCFIAIASRNYLGAESASQSKLLPGAARWRGWILMTFSLWATVLLAPEFLGVALMVGLGYLMYEVMHLGSDFLNKAFPLTLESAIFAVTLLVGAHLLLAMPAWTLEKLSVRSALRRARTLSHGTHARIIFVRLTAPVFASILDYLLILLPFLVFTVLFKGFGGRMFFYRHRLGFNMVADTVVATLIGPVFPIALTLFYYDQRIRHEGFDIERMMDAAGLNPPAMLEPANAPASTPADSPAVPQTAPNPVEEGQA